MKCKASRRKARDGNASAIAVRLALRSTLAGLLGVAAFPASFTFAQSPAGSSALPDVYLVTIDTLRADHIHCYGYDQIQTPTLDELAQEGIRFAHAFTPSPITNTAHTSILTGLLPSEHGVTDFGIPLVKSYPTWAELLKQNGYQTAAFIGAVVLDAATLAPGLDRGFDYYDNFPSGGDETKHWGRVERRGGEVVEHAETWMTAHPGHPRFVWVHLYDPHDPYEPPPPYAQTYKDHLYDGEIAYADNALGNLIDYLKRENRYTNALILVVGDHGEGLGEHGEQTHGVFLYDSTTHVPLIIKLPTHAATQKKVVEAQVETTDLLPTVLDLLQVAASPAMRARSLAPYFVEKAERGAPVFSETAYPLRFGWAPLRSVREDGFKLIESPRPELYDLRKDPAELHNAYAPGNATVQQLRKDLVSSPMRVAAEAAKLPDAKDGIEQQNLLHSAMMSADEGRTQDARLLFKKVLQLNPESSTALQQSGELALKAGDYQAAVEFLQRARKVNPEDASAALYEGQALEKLGNAKGAKEALDAAVTLAPGQLEPRLLLAQLDFDAGDRSAAEDQLEAVLLLDPANQKALIALGKAYLAEKRSADAIALLEPQTGEASVTVELLDLLRQSYVAAGRTADAEKIQARLQTVQPRR